MSRTWADCDLDTFIDNICLPILDDQYPGNISTFLEVSLLAIAFCGLAAAADHVCNALETFCDRKGIPEDVGGATFLAFGGALPETTINTITTIRSVLNAVNSKEGKTGGDSGGNSTALGVGAIVGSGMIAFLIIPSVCYMVSPGPMKLKRRPLIRDVCFYLIILSILIETMKSGVTLQICYYFLATYITYLLVLLFGRRVRLFGLRMAGIEYNENHTSVFRDRYESNPADTLNATLLPVDEAFEDEEEAGVLMSIYNAIIWPVNATCIDCRINEPHESLYPLCCLVGLLWTTFYSWVVTCVVSNWVREMHEGFRGMGFFGVAVCAIGAEIPDTINAATAASRGYGSMAVASAIGSQILNVGLGLGMPWAASTAAGFEVPLVWPNTLAWMAELQRFNAFFVLVLLLWTSIGSRDKKARLTCWLCATCLILYAVALTVFGIWTFDEEYAQGWYDAIAPQFGYDAFPASTGAEQPVLL